MADCGQSERWRNDLLGKGAGQWLEIIDQCRKDKDEIGEIAFLSELKKRREKIDEINEALLRYF